MGNRGLYLMLAALLGGAAGIVPGLAAGDTSPSASFTATDFAWNANGGSGNTVTIQPGQSVSFAYPSGASQHNADFGASPAPIMCTQTAGASSGSVPPLPNQPTPPGWSGTCTFNTPGTYNFHCDLHHFMSGTIVVPGAGTTSTGNPPPTTTSTTPTTTTITTTPTTTTPGTTTAQTSPSAATPPRVSIRHTQRGLKVAGSVTVAAAYAGGSLEVDVYSRGVRVARLLRRALGTRTTRFSISLGHAQSALRRRHRLTLTVDVFVRAPHQPTRSSKLTVLLLGPGA